MAPGGSSSDAGTVSLGDESRNSRVLPGVGVTVPAKDDNSRSSAAVRSSAARSMWMAAAKNARSSRRSSRRGSGTSTGMQLGALAFGLKSDKNLAGKAASLNASSKTNVTVKNSALNNRWLSRLSQLVPRLLRASPLVAIGLGAVLYFFSALLFAAFYYALGEQCYAFQARTRPSPSRRPAPS